MVDSPVTTLYTQVFSMSKRITFQNTGLIYLVECKTCESSYVGYSIGNLPKRFSNHKSHIKHIVKSCRLTNNFLDKDHDLVILGIKTRKNLIIVLLNI